MASQAQVSSRRYDFQAVIASYVDKKQSRLSFGTIVKDAINRARRKVKINMNGQIFILSSEACERIPSLQNLVKVFAQQSQTQFRSGSFRCSKSTDRDNLIELNFDRSSLVFSAIVDYVHNHELHVPKDVCPKLFARDLTFWGFSVNDVEPCCFSQLVHFLYEQDKLNDFQSFLYNRNKQDVPQFTGVSNSMDYPLDKQDLWRARVWRILDEPFNSIPSKIYFALICVFILLSFFAIAASTTAYFSDLDHTATSNTTGNDSVNATIVFHHKSSHAALFLVYLEYTCAVYLFLDYILRFVFFPNIRYFFIDMINITDGIAVLSFVTKCWAEAYIESDSLWIHAIEIMQLLRILRFLRPMSRMTSFRLMYFTLRCSYKELLLVVALLLFLSMIFSSMLYYVGDRKSIRSIPDAIWYSLITMTTVGYGDIVPADVWSMLIGSVLAVFGVIVMTMTTPIMVSNFHSLYINAIIGQPSTLKKVQTQLDKRQPFNSLESEVASPSEGLVTRSSRDHSRRSYAPKRKEKVDCDSNTLLSAPTTLQHTYPSALDLPPSAFIVENKQNITLKNRFRNVASRTTGYTPQPAENTSQPPFSNCVNVESRKSTSSTQLSIQPTVSSKDTIVIKTSVSVHTSGQKSTSRRMAIFPIHSSSDGEEADKDTYTDCTTTDEKTFQHADDFNQNMMRKNRALLRPRFRTWYANYETSDTDSTESESTESDGQVDVLVFDPPRCVVNARRASERRKRRLATLAFRRKRSRR